MSDSAVRLMPISPDPSAQPPRIYTTVREGGSIVRDPEVARALAEAGFVVVPFDASPQEASYLAGVLRIPVASGERLYLVRCDGSLVQYEGTRYRCVPPEGVVVEDVRSIPAGPPPEWLEPALAVVPRSALARAQVVSASRDATPAEEGAAAAAIGAYERIRLYYPVASALIETMSAAYPGQVPTHIQNLLARDQEVLARYAQPVALATGATTAVASFGAARFGLAWLTATTIILVTSGVAASLIVLAIKSADIVSTWAENESANRDLERFALAMANNPNSTTEGRRAAADYLTRSRQMFPQPQGIFDGVTEALLSATGLLYAGAAVAGLGLLWKLSQGEGRD